MWGIMAPEIHKNIQAEKAPTAAGQERIRNLLLIASVVLNIGLGAFVLNSYFEAPIPNISAVPGEYQAQIQRAAAEYQSNSNAMLEYRQASQHFVALLAKENVTLEELLAAMRRTRQARELSTAAYHQAFAEFLVTLPLDERLKIRDAIVGSAGRE